MLELCQVQNAYTQSILDDYIKIRHTLICHTHILYTCMLYIRIRIYIESLNKLYYIIYSLFTADIINYTLYILLFITVCIPSPFIQVAKENARPIIPKFVNHHLQRIIDICWNADPNKRPRFDKIQPILDKLEV